MTFYPVIAGITDQRETLSDVGRFDYQDIRQVWIETNP